MILNIYLIGLIVLPLIFGIINKIFKIVPRNINDDIGDIAFTILVIDVVWPFAIFGVVIYYLTKFFVPLQDDSVTKIKK